MTMFISLDVGGTRCRGFGLRWPEGPAIPLEAPSKNLRAILDIELGRLLLTIRDQLATAGPIEPAVWLIGAAGGRPDRDRARIAQLLQDLGIASAGIEVSCDFEANHAAAFGGEDGLLSVNGTGSVLFGRWQGMDARRAGWGYLLDEVPSAGAFGRLALQAILQLQAGTPVSAVWGPLVAESLPPEAATSASLLDHIYASPSPQKMLAGFATLFTRAWAENCPWARARMLSAFDLWALEMGHLADRLAVPQAAPYSGLGGLWKDWTAGHRLAELALEKAFPGRFIYRAPRFDPAWGPLLRHLQTAAPNGKAVGETLSRLAANVGRP